MRHNVVLYLIYYWIPPLFWSLCIFYMSTQTSIRVSQHAIVNFILFKFLHMVEYGLLFFLFYRAFYSMKINVAVSFFFPFLLTVFYSISDEFHQLFVVTRQGRLRDVIIDGIGIIVMYTIIKKIKFVRTLL